MTRAAPRIATLAAAWIAMIAIGVAHGTAGMDAGVGTGIDQGLVISPQPLDFGMQQVGTSSSKSLMLDNTNSVLPITINSPLGKPNTPSCNQFNVTPSPALPDTIPAMTTRTWSVKFLPTVATFYDCAWTLSTNDGNAYTIHLTGQGVAGHITASPNPLDFGPQPVGNTVTQPVTLSNDGSGSISVTGINQTSGNPPFSITQKPNLPVLLAPGSATSFTVQFMPTSTGSFMGHVGVTDDGPSASTPTDVTLLGSGGGTGSGAALTMSPNPVDFGSVGVGGTGNSSVTVGSTAPTPAIVVSAMNITGAQATDFSFADSSLGCNSGQSCTMGYQVTMATPRKIGLACSPSSPGLRFATLSVTSSASGGTTSVTLQCNGSAPNISVSPPSISYGTVRVNTTAHANLHISNTGDATLNISTISIDGTNPGDFAAGSCAGGCAVGSGGGTDVDVTFTPPVRGVRSANLHVMSDDPTTPDVVVGLDGAGGLPQMVITQPANKMINFGGIPINTTSSTAPVTVQNQGELTLNIMTAGTAAPFGVSTGPTAPFGLAPSASATWQLTCHPPLPMPYNGSFAITGDDPNNGSDMVSLSCTGINSNITAQPNPVSFGEVRTDRMVMQDVVFTNTGALPVTINSAPIDAPFTEVVTGLPRTLNQNDTLTVTVKFAPAPPDMHYTGNLSLVDSGGTTAAMVALSGDGRVPNYMVAPTTVDFGSLCVAQADNQDITISNDGTAHISLVSTVLSGSAFAISSGNVTTPIDLAPTAQHTVTIVGTAAQGPSSGMLVVTTDVNAKLTTNVSLSITGTQSGVVANPSSVAFGAHDVGVASSPMGVAVINCSSKALTVSSVAVTGADAAAFAPSGTQPVTIPIGGSQSWNVVFTAMHAGAHTAQLELHNDGPTDPLVVTLGGSGNGSQGGGDGGMDAGNGEQSTSYYACSCRTSSPGAGAPIAIAFVIVLRRRRARR